MNKKRQEYLRNREKYLKRAKDHYRKLHPMVKQRPQQKGRTDSRIWYRYRLDEEGRQALLTKQNHCCALCHKPFGTERRLRPIVDHNHKTNQVRALLHSGCNTKLSSIEDNGFLEQALRYLEISQCVH